MEHAAIRLEAGGKTPFHEQLYAYFAAAIRSGTLAPGERLPSKRRLAQDVGEMCIRDRHRISHREKQFNDFSTTRKSEV